jgi:hypothetical protein
MDIDIDFLNRDSILKIIKHIPAAIIQNNGLIKKHNSGIYVQRIPFNPLTNTASIDYREAEARGYFKIDFLNVSAYTGVKSEQHLCELMEREPLWDLLLHEDFSSLLFHLNGHHDVLIKMKPNSIEKLAAVLAMIRPGKRHLVGESWPKVMEEVWKPDPTSEYYWKKSHAFAYASLIVVQMNLICDQATHTTL